MSHWKRYTYTPPPGLILVFANLRSVSGAILRIEESKSRCIQRPQTNPNSIQGLSFGHSCYL
jgi:hypothetical protein